jgi:hypothetical protein
MVSKIKPVSEGEMWEGYPFQSYPLCLRRISPYRSSHKGLSVSVMGLSVSVAPIDKKGLRKLLDEKAVRQPM